MAMYSPADTRFLVTMADAPVPAHEIIIVPAVGEDGCEELRQQCYDVRIDVFHHEQKFPLETEIDECASSPPSLTLSLLLA